MSSKFIAVEGMTFELSPNTVSGCVTILTPPSAEVEVQGKRAYFGNIDVIVTNIKQCAKGSAVAGSVKGKIFPTSTTTKVRGKAVLREGDKSDTLVAYDAMQPGPNGAPVPSPIQFTLTVVDAGQATSPAK